MLRHARDIEHRFAHFAHVRVILAAVRGDDDDRPLRVDPIPSGRLWQILASGRQHECVDDRVAGHDDVFFRNVFAQQMFARKVGRRKMKRGNGAGDPPVHLLGKRKRRIARA